MPFVVGVRNYTTFTKKPTFQVKSVKRFVNLFRLLSHGYSVTYEKSGFIFDYTVRCCQISYQISVEAYTVTLLQQVKSAYIR